VAAGTYPKTKAWPALSAGVGKGRLPMSPAEVAGIVERVCGSKLRYESPSEARRVARRLRAKSGRPVHHYRCPFGDGTRAHAHWHVGRLPSVASLRRIALAIRTRSQGSE
jgi:hypothetical protein